METFSALLAICAGNSPVPVNSPHKGQWRGALMFSLIYAWINDWVNNREAGDLRCHRGHCDVDVMNYFYLEMVRPHSLCIYTCAYIVAMMSHERRGVSTHRHPNCLFTRSVFWYCVHRLRLVWVVIDQVIDRPTDWLNVDIAWPLLA